MSDFPKGIFVKNPHANAPDFVKYKVSIKIEDAIAWLKTLSGEYVNLDLKVSKENKPYLGIDSWKPETAAPAAPPSPDNAPF
jgi:hypothetical protein